MLNISYSQNFEDLLISRLFRKQRNGFYIDVGAAHPVKDSVTKYFYDRGWRGVNVEPNKEYFELLRKSRKGDVNLNCAVFNKNGEVKFTKIPQDLKISYVGDGPKEKYQHVYEALDKEIVSLPARTLSNICEEFASGKQVDFLKIDVEGAEDQVLEGMDFSIVKPRLIVMESVGVKSNEIADSPRAEEILKENEYTRVYFDGINSYFAQNDDLEAAKLYSIPLNASDDVLTAKNTRLSFLLKILVSKFINF